jgi:hypothetical protein
MSDSRSMSGICTDYLLIRQDWYAMHGYGKTPRRSSLSLKNETGSG